jgi:hypothetical protein
MKLNFWQWLGIIIFAIALIIIIKREMAPAEKVAPNPSTTQPAA